jgi:shikimate dehydrogenase
VEGQSGAPVLARTNQRAFLRASQAKLSGVPQPPISAHTRSIAIIGDPIEHSVTPRIQNAAYREIGADLVNVAYRVVPENLEKAVRGAQALGLLGLMVTLPHKEAVLALCDELHFSAQMMGAANLLQFRSDGKIIGHSSDGFAAVKSLEEEGVTLRNARVAILGGGGAARSLALTFAAEGAAEIAILNRTVARAQIIAEEVRKLGTKSTAAPIENHSLGKFDVLVNATSLGMTPQVDTTPIPQALLCPETAVYDIVYNPLETRLLREAREVSAKGIDGLGMVIYTNVYAAQVCAGVEISAAVMRREALMALL